MRCIQSICAHILYMWYKLFSTTMQFLFLKNSPDLQAWGGVGRDICASKHRVEIMTSLWVTDSRINRSHWKQWQDCTLAFLAVLDFVISRCTLKTGAAPQIWATIVLLLLWTILCSQKRWQFASWPVKRSIFSFTQTQIDWTCNPAIPGTAVGCREVIL